MTVKKLLPMTESMSSNSIPDNLRDLMVKLTFIAKTERGYKVNMNNLSFSDGESWVASVSRSFGHESRNTLISDLQQLIKDTIFAIDQYAQTEFLPRLINHLSAAKAGIQNLAHTYQDDPGVCSNIALILEDINIQLEFHKNLLYGHTK